MRKALTVLTAMVAVALVAGAQDRGGKKPPECDLKSVEPAKWCEKCDKILEKGDIEKDKHKGDCGGDVKNIELCVKKCWAADCHPDKELKPGGS
jgi:hypothetical protein